MRSAEYRAGVLPNPSGDTAPAPEGRPICRNAPTRSLFSPRGATYLRAYAAPTGLNEPLGNRFLQICRLSGAGSPVKQVGQHALTLAATSLKQGRSAGKPAPEGPDCPVFGQIRQPYPLADNTGTTPGPPRTLTVEPLQTLQRFNGEDMERIWCGHGGGRASWAEMGLQNGFGLRNFATRMPAS